ncbi:MAG: MFS transporter [Candidatus Saccharibacteria bacterium]|nr:MFS transporter [Candidatus Saccharibacteria bacterium]
MLKIRNYQVLFYLNLLKGVIDLFIDSFLVLYLLTLSDGNILPLGIYKIISMVMLFIPFYLLRNVCKTKKRGMLLKIGICLNLLFFLVIILLREQIVDYIYVIGVLYGIKEGVYYSVINVYESDGVSNAERARFQGNTVALKAILAVSFSMFFGSLIALAGFLESFLVILGIVVVMVVLALLFRDKAVPRTHKVQFGKFSKVVLKNKNIRQIYKISFLLGLTYSGGAITSVTTLYIIKVFSDSFSMGVFNSVFNLLAAGVGVVFAKYLKKKNYAYSIVGSMTLTIVSLVVMILDCNAMTIIIFNFFQTISQQLTNMINTNATLNIANSKAIQAKYKVEYFTLRELMLTMGRVISQGLFIAMAFVDVTNILPFFVGFLALYMLSSARLQWRHRRGHAQLLEAEVVVED